MLAETRYEHVVLNESHIPLISGTTMKVIELVLAQAAYGWTADELHIQFFAPDTGSDLFRAGILLGSLRGTGY